MDLNKVIRIINEWDPLDFFPAFPSDEYKDEIAQIFELSTHTTNVEELARGIIHIFEKSFGENVFYRSFDECLTIAKKILEDIKDE